MRVSSIQFTNYNYNKTLLQKNSNGAYLNTYNNKTENYFTNLSYNKIGALTFREHIHKGRSVPDIELDDYLNMSDTQKKYYRKRYERFQDKIDPKQLIDSENTYLPLRSEQNMNDFLKISSIYNQFKNDKILCLGRSPKWFLNASMWMKNGIDNYKFVAFSGFWFYPHRIEGMKKLESGAPRPEDIKAYRKYLKNIKCDPYSIVKDYEIKHKKTIITDYICTGKGMTSFLELMSDYAEEQGVLDKFADAIKIVGIGSMDYMEELDPYSDDISQPEVIMPPKLRPYENKLKTTFYNISYPVFYEMLLNQNSNECRSTYYPHKNWTLYRPNKFKTGIIKDMKKVDALMKLSNRKTVSSFEPAMMDYRNLLNFRILDALNVRGLLKDKSDFIKGLKK